ncbi:MAG TPA: D-alanyl-D-alanine carboxypeptidase, partial [Actinomycetota bacterium]|nr:D-alanyl-D-alanine carboxypeptidase [Actinomycetota bacterium]
MTTTRSSVTTQLRPQSALTVAASLACGALVLVTLAPAADAQPVSDSSTSSSSTTGPDSEGQLRSILAAQMAQGPATSGAYVVNLDDGHVVFDDRGDTKRLSASVTKLYTTSTALIRLGQGTRLSTGVLGTGRRVGTTWTGDLYLRGAGDFTFGTVAFARKAYGSRASVERLATQLRQSGIRHIRGRVLADASLFGDNGGSEFGLVLCRNPLFGPRCPYGPAGRF